MKKLGELYSAYLDAKYDHSALRTFLIDELGLIAMICVVSIILEGSIDLEVLSTFAVLGLILSLFDVESKISHDRWRKRREEKEKSKDADDPSEKH